MIFNFIEIVKIQKVPEGDWFCSRCKPNQEPQLYKKKRQAFVYTEEEEEDDDEEEEEEEEDNDVQDEEESDDSDDSAMESMFEDSP